MPATSSEVRDPVSALRRYAAIVVIKKIERATALPTGAIAVRSTKFARSSTTMTEITRPRVPPTRATWPKTGGNISDSASFAVDPVAA